MKTKNQSIYQSKALRIFAIAAVVLLGGADSAVADDEAWAMFENKKDRIVEVRVSGGRVFVTGTNSDTVTVRARRVGVDETEERTPADDPRAAGLRKISHGETGLETWADGNVVTVATRSMETDIELYIRVPRNAALDISSHFADSVHVRNIRAAVTIRSQGAVRLEKVDGEIEVEAGSWIYLSDVSGSVVGNSQLGGIEGAIERLRLDEPVSLSATGPIDVALPASAKATLYMKTTLGEVFSDFDMKVERRRDTRRSGKVHVLPPLPSAKPVRPARPPRPPRPVIADSVDVSAAPEVSPDVTRSYDAAVEAYYRAQRQLEEEKKTRAKVLSELQRDLVRIEDVYIRQALAPSLSPTLVGEINGGGIEIRLTSMSGNIYVRRGR